MTNKIYISIFIFIFSFQSFAFRVNAQQLKLGNNITQIEKSAVLQLDSKNQGLLLSRLSDTDVINSLSPPDGIIIYSTKPAHKGIYERRNRGWRYQSNLFATSKDMLVTQFKRMNDTVMLTIPDAGSYHGLISDEFSSDQKLYGAKSYTDSLVSLGWFNSESDVTVSNNLVLKELPAPKPGYLLSTNTDGKVIWQTDPNSWVVGGNDLSSEAAIGTKSLTDLSVITHNSDRMHIKADGKVGIGTISPSTKLDVSGSFKLGRDGSSFENITSEDTSEIKSYLKQINVAKILVLGDKVGPYVFTLNVPGVKKDAWVVVNPANDWSTLNMNLRAALLQIWPLPPLLDLNLPLGGAEVRIAWARAVKNNFIEICLLFDFNGVANLNALSNELNTLVANLNNPLLNIAYSSTPIDMNILYVNRK